MIRRATVLAALSACGSDDAPTDITCRQQLVYLNRTGGSFSPGTRDDAIHNISAIVDTERTLEPWPHTASQWEELVACMQAGFVTLPRITLTEEDPGTAPHFEIVFTTTYWGGSGTTNVIPGSCGPGNQIEFLFGSSLPTAARACHLAMQGFALMTAQLSHGSDCHDFVNNAIDCSTTRSFLDQTVDCVDTSNQPAACRCGSETTQNTHAALEARFPACP